MLFFFYSGKALWGVICGTYVLPSDEVVGAELQLASPHLRIGLAAYSKPSGDHYQTWAQTAEATQAEKDFVKKLSQLLVSNIDYNLYFCMFDCQSFVRHYFSCSLVLKPCLGIPHYFSYYLWQDLSATHSWEIFQLFLLHEYRGAEASLAEVLANQRDEETFMAKLWSFYLGDRLHLLRCVRHIVANTANSEHPYQVVLVNFRLWYCNDKTMIP